MKNSNSFSFVSLSAFLHGLAFLGLALLPALKLLPAEEKTTIEISDVSEGSAFQQPAPAPALPIPVEPAAVQAKAEPPKEVVKTQPRIRTQPKPVIAALPKKIVPIDVSPTEESETEAADPQLEKEVAKAQESSEAISVTDNEEFVPAPEIPVPAKPEQEVVESAVQTAAAAALSSQAVEEPLPPPTTRPMSSTLSTPINGAGSNELDGNAGPSSDDLRSYLDLKQAAGNRAPMYPMTARRQGWQGEVLLCYYVTAQGTVSDVKLMRSSGYAALDQEAIRAISKYRFEKGQEGWASHPVVFSLKSSPSAQNGNVQTSQMESGS